MLFNSYVFLFAFLPLTYLGWLAISRISGKAAIAWLALASLVYYGWSSTTFLAIFLFSFAVNAACVGSLDRLKDGRWRWMISFAGITFNLTMIGYFKYKDFFLTAFTGGMEQDFSLYKIALPIGISFYTFQQIAYIVDAYRRVVTGYSVINHLLFISFFPQLIAGPIVHHKEMMPQFARPEMRRKMLNLGIGLSIFAVGLFKKTVIADGIAHWADPAFAQVADGHVLTFAEAWIGALAYSFQLYFDFSAYSDMALGLARMFGITLPLNFNSPYKAKNIVDFWRRWHMTLSRFLRDYLYFPLGGNRKGVSRRYANLITVMVIGGLWHGAGWTFVFWGFLHGIYLMINNLWRTAMTALGLSSVCDKHLYRLAAWAITFVAVVSAWVPFRASSISSASNMLKSMYGLQGGPVGESVWLQVVQLRNGIAGIYDIIWVALSGQYSHVDRFNADLSYDMGLAALLYCAAIAFFMPNTYDLFFRYCPAITEKRRHAAGRGTARLTPAWAFGFAAIMLIAVLQFPRVSPFLYFQF
ncbi:MBOAT family protein [Magnetovibrio sp.]|uniref:MBOAT family O-acyltransferase n=1 Tax=Magnetovibrio sp. TaxID=2024836 RepID=UPI002F92FD6F